MARKKKTVKKVDEKKQRKIDKRIYTVLIVAAVLLIVFVVSNQIFEGINKFEYNGLTFTKEKINGVKFYRYYYFFNNDDGNLVKYNHYVRIDPRENDVPVEGEISFPTGRFTYISTNITGLDRCEYNGVALAGLSLFLENNGINSRGATPDALEAEAFDVTHANCTTHPRNVVILIQGGEETSIVREGEHCHVVTVQGCDLLEALEKFQTQAIIDAKAEQESEQ
jgi:hypothetical protein